LDSLVRNCDTVFDGFHSLPLGRVKPIGYGGLGVIG